MTKPRGLDPDFARLFDDLMSARSERSIGRDITLDRKLWTTLGESDLTTIASDSDDGTGWVEAAGLLRSAAHHGARVPLAEHDLLGGWLLAEAGLKPAGGIRTVVVLPASGVIRNVPWAAHVESLVVLAVTDSGCRVDELAASAAQITAGHDLAGQPRDAVEIDPSTVGGVEVAVDVAHRLQLRGAVARAVQTAGALGRIVDLTVEHATTRKQFGRPISRFQAVQHLVADAVAEAALASVAADAAVAAIEDPDDIVRVELAVAVARSVVGRAVGTVVRNAHQVHGAIGTTLEHRLREFSGPALAWRHEFGSVREWEARLMAGGGELWRRAIPS